MNRRLFAPGEVDDDAYGPPADEIYLPLPLWNPGPLRSQQDAFTQWCLAMLDREAEEHNLEAAMRELQGDERAIELLRDIAEEPLFKIAKTQMPFLTREAFQLFRHGAEERALRPSKKRGRKPNPKVVAAVIDNARLTALFKRHFHGDYRRPSKPGRIDILRARHGLTEAECNTVEGYLD